MTITRRNLLQMLLASAAAEVIDVEKLLWVPKPIVTVPAMPAPALPNVVRFWVRGREYLADMRAFFLDTRENVLYANANTPEHPIWKMLREDAKVRIQSIV